MDAPLRFPSTEDELGEWSVYADWLLTRGVPLGDLIARELSLAAMPERDPLQAFHSAGRRLARAHRWFAVGWCLGHARTLTLTGGRQIKLGGLQSIREALIDAYNFLRTPAAARLEAFTGPYQPRDEPRRWRRLLSALPATCTKICIEIEGGELIEDDALDLLANLPTSARRLSLDSRRGRIGPAALTAFLSDRFEVLDLSDHHVPAEARAELRDALARTRSLQLRVADLPTAGIDRARCRIGRDPAAALIEHRSGHVAAIARWPLLRAQRRYGLVPARTQIAGLLPEDHDVRISYRGVVTCQPSSTANLVRRGERWTLRGDDSVSFWCGGRALASGVITEVRDGDVIAVATSQHPVRIEHTLVTHDLGFCP